MGTMRDSAVQLLSRASELSNVHSGDTGIFNLAVTATAIRIQTDTRCKRKKIQPPRENCRLHTPISDLLEIILTFQACVTPGIVEESVNIHCGIFIISDNEGEGYLVPGKAWFIARIRDLNCRPTRGTGGTWRQTTRRNLLFLSRNWLRIETIKNLLKQFN